VTHPEPQRAGPTGAVAPRGSAAAELVDLDRLDAAGRALADKARAGSTRAAYDRDWGRFRAWCDERGLEAMPAEPRTLTRYLADLASPRSRPAGADDRPEDVVDARVVVADGLRPATIARYLASISVRHQAEAADEPNPAANAHVRAVLAGIRRDYADHPSTARPKRQKTAARTRAIRVLVGPDPARHPELRPGPEEPGYTRLLRDRALILIGWKAALRRSELAALVLGDIRVESDAAGHDGLTVTLDRSKTDQTATGATVWIAGAACTCATTAATTSTATTSTAATTGRPGEETSAVGEGDRVTCARSRRGGPGPSTSQARTPRCCGGRRGGRSTATTTCAPAGWGPARSRT